MPVATHPLAAHVAQGLDWLVPPLRAPVPATNASSAPLDSFPWYHLPRDSLWPGVSDKYLALAAPVAVYWALSLLYELVDRMQWPFFEQYRLHEPEEITARNRVSKRRVIGMVALQQVVQTMLGLVVLEPEEVIHAQQSGRDHQAGIALVAEYQCRLLARLGPLTGRLLPSTSMKLLTHAQAAGLGRAAAAWTYWWGIPIAQFLWAFFVLDTWQYILHRMGHESRFLYNHFHSHHHRLYVPYAFGALYNHPVEGLLLDSLGAALAHFFSLMSVRQGVLLFAFCTMKTVDDHGGYAFPWWIDPLHLFFPNTAEYHDIHHQTQGLRFNYSQPFFIHWDVLLGTRMDQNRLVKVREHAARQTWKTQLRQKRESEKNEPVAAKTGMDTAPKGQSNSHDGSRPIAPRAAHAKDAGIMTRELRQRLPNSPLAEASA